MQALIEALDAAPSVWFHIPLTGRLLAAHQSVSADVQRLLGPLEGGGSHHITVLYMGRLGKDVDAGNVPAIIREAPEAWSGQNVAVSPAPSSPVTFFEPSEASEHRTPIIMRIASPSLETINIRLLRRMVPYTVKQQFVDYAPHATFGYLPRTLTQRERDALADIPGPVFQQEVKTIHFDAGDVTRRFELSP